MACVRGWESLKERDYLADLPIHVSVKLIFLETGMKGTDWVHLTHDRDQQRDAVEREGYHLLWFRGMRGIS